MNTSQDIMELYASEIEDILVGEDILIGWLCPDFNMFYNNAKNKEMLDIMNIPVRLNDNYFSHLDAEIFLLSSGMKIGLVTQLPLAGIAVRELDSEGYFGLVEIRPVYEAEGYPKKISYDSLFSRSSEIS